MTAEVCAQCGLPIQRARVGWVHTYRQLPTHTAAPGPFTQALEELVADTELEVRAFMRDYEADRLELLEHPWRSWP